MVDKTLQNLVTFNSIQWYKDRIWYQRVADWGITTVLAQYTYIGLEFFMSMSITVYTAEDLARNGKPLANTVLTEKFGIFSFKII